MNKRLVLGVVFLLSLISVVYFASGTITDCGGIGGSGCAGNDRFTDCTTYGCFIVKPNLTNDYTFVIDGGGFMDVSNPNSIMQSQTAFESRAFYLHNSTDSKIFGIGNYARVRFRGTVSEDNGGYCTPPANSLIVQDGSGNCVAYIDDSGNGWFRGEIGINANVWDEGD